MSSAVSSPKPPAGLARLLYRAPVGLYRLGLGRLLGSRFVLLNHVGRKSGQPRQAVLEVVDYDPSTHTCTVVSAWGPQSDWYRNILAEPAVTINFRGRAMAVTADPYSPEASGEAMVTYARRHPGAARSLLDLVGYEVSGSEEDYRRVGSEKLRFVALRPRLS